MARILRGDIVWADLNPVRGREQAAQVVHYPGMDRAANLNLGKTLAFPPPTLLVGAPHAPSRRPLPWPALAP